MSKTYEQLEPVISALDRRIKTNLEAYPTDTADGSVASFSDGADAPMKSLVVNINPVQSGSGDPSPTNIRPISGWTGMNVTKRGINIWDEVWEVGGISGDGFNYNTTDRIRSKNYIPVVPGETYYYKATSGAGLFAWGYDKDKLYVGRIPSNGYAVGNNTVTILDGVHYIRIVVQPGYGTTYNNDISINYPATDTDYHPHSGESLDIAFPTEAGTVYGGTLDVLTGFLTVTKGFIQSYNGEALPSSWISDRDVYAQGATPTTGAEVCYDLATPITYQLTPHEVKSLLGQNNIWADCGNVSVKYRADTTTFINRKIAEAINALA